MLIHYLSLSWDQLKKYRLQSAVSIVSLAIGFACFALAAMWIKYETTYDAFHKDADDIYCLMRKDKGFSGGYSSWSSTIPVSDSIIARCPEIDKYMVFFWSSNFRRATSMENDSIYLENTTTLYCDSSFFDFFPVRFLIGNKDFLLDDNKIAITQEAARKLWKNENPIGKRLTIGAYDNNEFIVAAVVEGWGEHTNIPFSFIQNLSPHDNSGPFSYRNYALRLHPNVDIEKLNEKLAALPMFNLPRHNPMEMDCVWSVLPLTKLHQVNAKRNKSFQLNHIYLFSIAGGLLILCGLLNYLTMFINRLFIRKREIALRRVFGASSGHLMTQFLVEYGLVLVIAMLLGFFILNASLDWFCTLSKLPYELGYIYSECFIYMLVVIAVSFLVSIPFITYFRRQSLQIAITGVGGLAHYNIFRRISTCFQIGIAFFCIFCTVVLQKQLNELRHGDIGFDHERTVEITIFHEEGFDDEKESFLHYLRQQPEVESLFNGYPLYPRGPITSYIVKKSGEIDLNVQTASITAYYDWDGELSRFHNLRLIEGRLLQPGEDPSNVVINESTAKLYDWDSPIGKRILNGLTVVGVVKDFKNNGPTMPAQPSILVQKREEDPSHYVLKYSAGKWSDHQKKYEEHIKSTGNNLYISFLPIEDKFNANLVSEDNLQTLLSITTIVCILIALFGVWSMIMLTCEQRRKEIAIRKVYGATTKDILDMFFIEYMSLQGIAAIVAFPIGYACMKPWLEQYVVQTEISWWIYVGIFLMVALLVALCVGWRVWETAKAKPADEIAKGRG